MKLVLNLDSKDEGIRGLSIENYTMVNDSDHFV